MSFDARQVLSAYKKKNKYKRHGAEGRIEIDAPEIFCLIQNPRESLQFLQYAAALAMHRPVSSIRFNQKQSKWTGLSAEVLMCIVAECAKAAGKKAHGTLSDDEECKRKSWTVGTPKTLDPRASQVAKLYVDVEQMKRRFTKRRYSGNAENPEIRNEAVELAVEYLDKCLKKRNLKITDEANQDIGSYLGEVTENAEKHAEMTDWTIAGYLGLPDETGQEICELAVCNFGRTIADSFFDLPKGDVGRIEVDTYLDLHKRKGLFKPGWDKEALATVISLQENVSRLKAQQPKRGNGMSELITFFQNVGLALKEGGVSTQPVMSLISGSTYILFDGQYQFKKIEGKKGLIAFNEDNDLHSPPDDTVVRALSDAYFPGTVFSLRFPLPMAFKEEIQTRDSLDQS